MGIGNNERQQPSYKEARSLGYFFHRQLWHLLALLIMVPIAWVLAAPVMGNGSWLGISDIAWFWLAVGMAIVHQVLVWIVFRLQLGWATLSKVLGSADLYVWGITFLPLLALRPLSILGLGYSTQNSLNISDSIAMVLVFFLLIPAVYTFYSVGKYFGIVRAMGGDHFRSSYRQMPLVNQGAFKYSGNAMYLFGFFLLWAIALSTGSRAALSVALFQHAYIWVHYFSTEKPDMEMIYGKKG